MVHVLFVCTGNIFRSMSAEYILKDLLTKKNMGHIRVSSAGTRGHPEPPFSYTIDKLHSYGLDPSSHKQRKITQEIVADADLIICMAEHHRQNLKSRFDVDSHLFNELAYGESTDVQDDAETDSIGRTHSLEEFVIQTVTYIYEAMPHVLKSIGNK